MDTSDAESIGRLHIIRSCPVCTELGAQLKVDPDRIIPNKSLSILDEAITAFGWNISIHGLCKKAVDEALPFLRICRAATIPWWSLNTTLT